jgi:hypothetical protein
MRTSCGSLGPAAKPKGRGFESRPRFSEGRLRRAGARAQAVAWVPRRSYPDAGRGLGWLACTLTTCAAIEIATMAAADAKVTQCCVAPLRTPTVTRKVQAPIRHVSRAAPRKMGSTSMKPGADRRDRHDHGDADADLVGGRLTECERGDDDESAGERERQHDVGVETGGELHDDLLGRSV